MAPHLRFDRNARYGAAIVAMMFGTYLLIGTDFGALIQAETYTGTIRTDIPLLNIVQFIAILLTLDGALALLPTSGWRRLGGVTLLSVVLLLWATLALERGVGNLGGADALWSIVLDQGFITLLACVGGWVIARGRHPLTWLVAAIALVPPFVAQALDDAEVTSGAYALVMQGVVVLGAFGAVWLAAFADGMLERRREAAPPAAVSGFENDSQ